MQIVATYKLFKKQYFKSQLFFFLFFSFSICWAQRANSTFLRYFLFCSIHKNMSTLQPNKLGRFKLFNISNLASFLLQWLGDYPTECRTFQTPLVSTTALSHTSGSVKSVFLSAKQPSLLRQCVKSFITLLLVVL